MSAEQSIFSFDEYSITDIQYIFDRNLMAQNTIGMNYNIMPDYDISFDLNSIFHNNIFSYLN